MRTALCCLLALVLLGCTNLYTNIVTITQIRYSAMNELGRLQRAGKISAETDAKIEKADQAYRAAAEVAEKALVAYKASGTGDDYLVALRAVKVAVSGILDILAPFLEAPANATYRTQLAKATKL